MKNDEQSIDRNTGIVIWNTDTVTNPKRPGTPEHWFESGLEYRRINSTRERKKAICENNDDEEGTQGPEYETYGPVQWRES